jgi:hypothetical protein
MLQNSGLLLSAAITNTKCLGFGANFDAQDGEDDYPLAAASRRGHQKVVELLPRARISTPKADTTAPCWSRHPATGQEGIVELLLDEGANVNTHSGVSRNDALQVTSFQSYEMVVELLLDKGANVNAQGGGYGNALHAASAEGHEKIVELLLDKGANVNVNGQEGDYDNALQVGAKVELDLTDVHFPGVYLPDVHPRLRVPRRRASYIYRRAPRRRIRYAPITYTPTVILLFLLPRLSPNIGGAVNDGGRGKGAWGADGAQGRSYERHS